MARGGSAGRPGVEQIREVVARDFVSRMEKTQGAGKPAELIAGLMNHISSDIRDSMLEHLGQEAPRLAQEVQRVMFTFSDIASRVGARGIAPGGMGWVDLARDRAGGPSGGDGAGHRTLSFHGVSGTGAADP